MISQQILLHEFAILFPIGMLIYHSFYNDDLENLLRKLLCNADLFIFGS